MLDIHSHILNGVDDGSKDMEESIEMAKIYLDNGIDKVIATPHYIEGFQSSHKKKNQKALEKLREALSTNGLNLDVYLGNEIYLSMDIISYLEKGIVSSLNDSRYVLIEMPMFDLPLYIEELIYELLIKDYIPIIAHPERNAKIIENPNILYGYIMKGALAQLNLPSLEGKYGDRIKTTGEILLKNNMIHFVGTDAHSKHNRSPRVERGLSILEKLVGEETYRRITYLNGLALLNNQDIVIDSPTMYKKRNKIFSFLKAR